MTSSKQKDPGENAVRSCGTPVEWAHYAIAATIIKLFILSDTSIGRALCDSVYANDRLLGRGKFIDTSRLKIGRQSLQNWPNFLEDDF